MDLNRRAIIGGAGVAAVLSGGSIARGADLPPKLSIDAFANKPPMADLVLSPDGQMVLARMQVHGTEMLGTYSIATRQFQNYALPKGADLRWFRWAGPDRILVSVIMTIKKRTEQIYIEGRITRLISFDLKTQTPHFIGPKEGGGASGTT